MSSAFSTIYPLTTALLATTLGMTAALLALRRSRGKSDVTVSVRRGRVRIELTASGNAREVNRLIGELLTSIDQLEGIETTVGENTESDSEITLVHAFNQVEQAARRRVAERLGGRGNEDWQQVGVFALRNALLSQKIWNSDEVSRFDNLVRMRNAVVHGDNDERPNSTEVRKAINDSRMLINSLGQDSSDDSDR